MPSDASADSCTENPWLLHCARRLMDTGPDSHRQAPRCKNLGPDTAGPNVLLLQKPSPDPQPPRLQRTAPGLRGSLLSYVQGAILGSELRNTLPISDLGGRRTHHKTTGARANGEVSGPGSFGAAGLKPHPPPPPQAADFRPGFSQAAQKRRWPAEGAVLRGGRWKR